MSPHLASFRERIQVNSELLSEESFVNNLQVLQQLCVEHKIPATEFELTFLMAALHFKQSNCEAVVLEVRPAQILHLFSHFMAYLSF